MDAMSLLEGGSPNISCPRTHQGSGECSRIFLTLRCQYILMMELAPNVLYSIS